MIKKRARKFLDRAVFQLMEEQGIENYAEAFVILKKIRPGLIEGYDFICRREGRHNRGLAEARTIEALHEKIVACAERETLTYLEAYEASVYRQT